MQHNLQVEQQLAPVQCANCGIYFMAPVFFLKKRREDHQSFYCPNGHGQHYPQKNEAELAKEKLTAVEERLQSALSRENELRRKYDSQQKRLLAGVCPCCKRTFKQLAAHMKNKHPDYA
jgi:protein-arginine kinase activator protein McsA